MVFLGDVSDKYQEINEVSSWLTGQAMEKQEICQCFFKKIELVAAPGDKPFKIRNYFDSRLLKEIGDSSD